MNTQNKSGGITTFVGILCIIGVICTAFYTLIYIWQAFASSPESVQAAIGAAVLTILGSVGSLIYSTQKNRQQEIEQALYEKKQPVYESLLNFIFDVLKKSKSDEAVDEQEMMDFVMQFSKELMLWGSDDVIKAYVKWKTIAATNPTPKDTLLSLEDLLQAIRLDFGHKNKGLKRGDLLSFIIIDMEELLKEDN